MKNKSKILLWLSLLSAVNSPARFSSIKEIKDQVQTTIVNTVSLNHKNIINMHIFDLVELYWLDKAKEIVRDHFLLEINKYKEWLKYKQNIVLTKVAQEHATYLQKTNTFSHKGDKWNQVWNRVDENWWYNYQVLSENISFRNNIKDVVFWYTKGQNTWHDEIFKSDYEDIWIWITDKSDEWWSEDNYYFVFVFWKEFK